MSDQPKLSRINLAVAFTVPLFLHRLLFIAPITRDNKQRLVPSKLLIVYYVCAMLLYVCVVSYYVIVSSRWTMLAIDTFGYTWYGIAVIDFCLTKMSFLFIGSMSVFRRHCQIEYFRTISAIDARLRRHCGVTMRYERLFVGYIVVLLLCLASTCGSYRIVLEPLSYIRVDLVPIWIVVVLFVVERMTVLLITAVFVCCALLIRSRLRRLASRLRWQRRQRGDGARFRAVGFEHMLHVYTELCRLVELLSGYMGAIMLMRFAHDFLSITTSAYFLCNVAIQLEGDVWRNWKWSNASALVMFAQQLARPVLVCMSAEWTLTAVGCVKGGRGGYKV